MINTTTKGNLERKGFICLTGPDLSPSLRKNKAGTQPSRADTGKQMWSQDPGDHCSLAYSCGLLSLLFILPGTTDNNHSELGPLGSIISKENAPIFRFSSNFLGWHSLIPDDVSLCPVDKNKQRSSTRFDAAVPESSPSRWFWTLLSVS